MAMSWHFAFLIGLYLNRALKKNQFSLSTIFAFIG
jgi:hypothetical protein